MEKAVFIHKSSLLDLKSENNISNGGPQKTVRPEEMQTQYKLGTVVNCKIVGYHVISYINIILIVF
jgi:hypothetical protein